MFIRGKSTNIPFHEFIRVYLCSSVVNLPSSFIGGCKISFYSVDSKRMLNHYLYRRSVVVLAILAIFAFLVAANAFSKDYVLELTIVTDRQEEFTQYIELNDREFRNLRNDPTGEIKSFLLEARKKYADEIGYRKEIYGAENYKMVVISSYSFVVKEKSSGRVLLSK